MSEISYLASYSELAIRLNRMLKSSNANGWLGYTFHFSKAEIDKMVPFREECGVSYSGSTDYVAYVIILSKTGISIDVIALNGAVPANYSMYIFYK